MDSQTIITAIQVLLVIVLGLVFLNLYLVFRLKEIDPFKKWNPHLLNGGLLMVFFIVGIIVALMATMAWYGDFDLVTNPGSEHGAKIDNMFWATMWVSVAVVLITNFLLFYFAWRYRNREGQKAYYYHHNNRLEYIWTAVPAVVMTVLIMDGLFTWHDIWNAAPERPILIEANAKQFDWTFRFPGEDLELGETSVNYMDDAAANQLGFNWADKTGRDDVVSTGIDTVYLPVDTMIVMKIKSRDVLHSATLAHFRVKMDAVPGMPTEFPFKITVSTDSMRKIKNDPTFNYEMSCQQICGGAHWNMRRVIKAVSLKEYQAWLARQKPYFAVWSELNPDAAKAILAADKGQAALTIND